MQLRKRAIEGMFEGEMTSHLGYEPHDPVGNGSRNGRLSKKVHSKDGELDGLI
jgi:putative transposase